VLKLSQIRERKSEEEGIFNRATSRSVQGAPTRGGTTDERGRKVSRAFRRQRRRNGERARGGQGDCFHMMEKEKKERLEFPLWAGGEGGGGK